MKPFTRLLHRLEPDTATLWREAAGQVEQQGGALVVDDSTLDKPYAKYIDLMQRHWSGKHYAVVEGINLITYDKAGDDLTNNDFFQALMRRPTLESD
jgi:hypothetical protein